MRQQTVEIIGDLVNSLGVTFAIDSVINNGDGTFTLNTGCTWWLSVEHEVLIGGNSYKITDFLINKYIIVEPVGAHVSFPASFTINAANYLHGTLKMSGTEVDAQPDKTILCPFVYLFEIINDKKNTDFESMIDRSTDLRIFFLNSVDSANWLTVDHYTYFVQPMQQMVDLFIEKIKNSALFTDNQSYECINLINVSENGTQEKSIFDCNLSGIELRLFAEIRKSTKCQAPKTTANVVVITDNENPQSPIEVGLGGVYTCIATDPKSGIAYKRVQPSGTVASYRVGDDYWQQINNPYSAQPTNPISFASLDVAAVAPFITLKDNNAFGTKDRFTNSLGLTATYDGSNGELADYAIDHLTGCGIWIVLPPTVLTWNDAIDYAVASAQNGFTDWRMASTKDFEPLLNANVGAPLNYYPFLGIGNFGLSYWTSTTRISNTTQVWYFSSSNGVRSFLTKTTSNKFVLIRNHY